MNQGEVNIFTAVNNSTSALNNGTKHILNCFVPEPHPACFDYQSPFDQAPFKLTWGKILSAIGMGLLIVISLGGNILVCTAFFYYQRLRTVTNYFVVSLAVSDLMVGALSMPLWLSYECTEWKFLPVWVDYTALSRFLEIFDVLSAVSSIANLTAISTDRFFSIMSPLHHRTRMTPRVALVMLALAWGYALGISLCRLIPNFMHYVALATSLGFFIPLIVILGSYVGIYAKVLSKRKTLCRRMEKDWNIASTLLIVILLFVICWTPFFILSLLYRYCEMCVFKQEILGHLISLVKWMHYLNSGCNPFVYGFFNANFKHAYKMLFKKFCGRSALDSDLSMPYEEESFSFIRRPYNSIKRRLSRRRHSQCSTKGLSEFEHSYSTLTGYSNDRRLGKRRTSSVRSLARNNSLRNTSGLTNGQAKNGVTNANTYVDVGAVMNMHRNTDNQHVNQGCLHSPVNDVNENEQRFVRYIPPTITEKEDVALQSQSVDKKDEVLSKACDAKQSEHIKNGNCASPPSYEECTKCEVQINSELQTSTNFLLYGGKESTV